MPDKKHNQSTVTEWYRAGHFSSEVEAMGAFKLAYQQAIDGLVLALKTGWGCHQRNILLG